MKPLRRPTASDQGGARATRKWQHGEAIEVRSVFEPSKLEGERGGMGPLTLDGSHGEGGGQILRTALSLSATTGRPIRLVNVRAGRSIPGLMAQHLSAVRAAAAICGATVCGDQLGSRELSFAPRHRPEPGFYTFDIAEIAKRGSAGSAVLLLQTLLVPLALSDAASTLVLRGGTHVQWSPSFDYLAGTYLPMLRSVGIRVDVRLRRWGWYPAGQGEIICDISGSCGPAGTCPKALELRSRAPLRRIAGRAVASSLPPHVAQRMAERAEALLQDLDTPVHIEAQHAPAACPGAGIFLRAEYGAVMASFEAYGRRGKPSESVAEEAVNALREHHACGAAIELHLADQLLLPLAFASSSSTFTVARPTGHLRTNAWAIGQFGIADISIEEGPPWSVRVQPRGSQPKGRPPSISTRPAGFPPGSQTT